MFNKIFFNKKYKKEFDFFEMLKMFNQLTHQNDKIYTDNEGKKFVLTKYGFSPVEQYNLSLINKELNEIIGLQKIQIIKLEKKINIINNETEILKNKIDKQKQSIKNNLEEINLKKNICKSLNNELKFLKEKLHKIDLIQEIKQNEEIPKQRQDKLLEKVTKMTEMLENLKEKSRNQKEQITNLLRQLKSLN
jgi:hypothetical protein